MSKSKLEAVIWDMDGVIADTIEYHFQAWREEFAKKGIDYTEEHFLHFFGQRNDTIIRDALGNDISPEEMAAINLAKQANFRHRAIGHIRPLPGAVELIKLLYARDIKQAIASSAPAENIEVITRSLGIKGCFQAVAYGTEVPEGKPSPQIYLLAAKKLGIIPANCIVFEDAIAGVEGARRGGMKCVAVTNSHPMEKLKQADRVVKTLEDISIDDLTALFQKL
jgi:HAD superfamily hydrolase (TIGR01509 family)